MAIEKDIYKIENFKGNERRHFNEWVLLEEKYNNENFIKNLKIRKRHPETKLPEKYEITFNIESIIGVNPPNGQGLQTPIFGNEHILTIEIPESYPADDDASKPKFKFITDVWHPQVVFYGILKGDVCLDFELKKPSKTPLTNYIDTIWCYLTYNICMPENRYPWPKDLTVARWVREQARKHEWVRERAEKYEWIDFTNDI